MKSLFPSLFPKILSWPSCLSALFLTTTVSHAQTLTWTASTNRNLGTVTNWNPQRIPAANDILVFNSNTTTQNRTTTQDVVAGMTVSGLVFDAGGSAITGNPLTLSSIAANHTGANLSSRVNLNLTMLGGGQISAPVGLLAIGESCAATEPSGGICNAIIRTLALPGPGAVTFSGAGEIRVGSAMQGAGGVTVTGNNVNFDHNHTYTGDTTVSGRLRVYDDLASHVIVQSGGTLSGKGRMEGGVTLNAGGQIDPGFRVRNDNATLQIDGDLEVSTTSSSFVTLGFDIINGINDRIELFGSLRSLNTSGRIIIDLRSDDPLIPGDIGTLIDASGTLFSQNNTGTNRISFYLPDGTQLVSGQQIIYLGAAITFTWTNDQLSFRVADDLAASLGTASWRGTAATNPDRWSQMDNWTTSDRPLANGLGGRTLSFTNAATAARRVTINDLDTQFWALSFTSSAYQINVLTGSTAQLRLSGGIEATTTATGTNTIRQPLLLSRAQTFAVRGSSELQINAPINLAGSNLTLELDPASTAIAPRITSLGPISGSGSLTLRQTRPGALANTWFTFGGTQHSTFTGPTRIESGTVFLNARAPVPSISSRVSLSSSNIDIGGITGVTTANVIAQYDGQIADNANVFIHPGSKLTVMLEGMRSLDLDTAEVTASDLILTEGITASGQSKITANTLFIANDAIASHTVDVASGGHLTLNAPIAHTSPTPLTLRKTGTGVWEQTGLTDGTIDLQVGTLIARGSHASGTKIRMMQADTILRGDALVREIEQVRGGIIKPGLPTSSAAPLRVDFFLGHSNGVYQPEIFGSNGGRLLSIEGIADLGLIRLDPQFTAVPAIGSRTKILLFPAGSNWFGSTFATTEGLVLPHNSVFTTAQGRWRIEYPNSTGLQATASAVSLVRLAPEAVLPFQVGQFDFSRSIVTPNNLLLRIIASSGPANSGVEVIVETSPDLITWTALQGNERFTANASGLISAEFSDTVTTGKCFYRLAKP